MNELALFAGAGGGILGGKLLGWRTVCAVEWNAYAASVLVQRQNDGCLDAFPIWDDVQTFDGRPWRGIVDVISGGFPCQDISVAGKGAGIEGDRSSMWKHMARIIGEVGPRYVLVENSPALVTRGLGVVLGDLAEMGYDAQWGVLGAVHAGAPHRRERIWIVGYANSQSTASSVVARRSERSEATAPSGAMVTNNSSRCRALPRSSNVADTDMPRCRKQRRPNTTQAKHQAAECSSWWGFEPGVGRVVDGVESRVDRLKAIGNGQVPAVVRLAWHLLRPTPAN